MKIYLAADHAGFTYKESLVLFLRGLGYEVVDCGAHIYDEADDYPDFVQVAAQEVSKDPEHNRGIVLGGSGQGEAIVSNRVFGVRAVVYYGGDLEIVRLGREHNDANILSLGARFITDEETQNAAKIFLETKFSGDDRHARRLHKIR